MIKFVVVEEELTLLLSRKAAEKMKLITVNYDKFQSVSVRFSWCNLLPIKKVTH